MRIAAATTLVLVFSALPLRGQEWTGAMIQLRIGKQRIEGMPLAWDESSAHLLGRDGRLWQFALGDATDFKKTADRFRGYSVSELRAALLLELRDGFEVTATSQYLVAHRQGERNKWAERFEDLYRSLVHYFSVRGFRPAKPPCLLIGIICPTEDDFRRYAARQGMAAPAGVQGYYALDSNRIILYDMGAKAEGKAWQQNAAVIIHEATHQTAFNSGVHSRYTPPPLWVAEGLATMFEAPGVYDSHRYREQGQRINRQRLQDFRTVVVPRHRQQLLAGMVADDDLFRRNPAMAYAEAWALTFYLVETQPEKYGKYLARTAHRPPFTEYTSAERTADFTAVFGGNWALLESHFLRFMAALQ